MTYLFSSYSFMDLLKDHNFVPTNTGVFYASNDNDIIVQKAA